MSIKTAVIWIAVAAAMMLILYIAYTIYKNYIAKYFTESQEQNATNGETMSQQRPPTVGATPAPTAPGYREITRFDAPPTYEEATRGDL